MILRTAATPTTNGPFGGDLFSLQLLYGDGFPRFPRCNPVPILLGGLSGPRDSKATLPKEQHVGLRAAACTWHFVDVVCVPFLRRLYVGHLSRSRLANRAVIHLKAKGARGGPCAPLLLPHPDHGVPTSRELYARTLFCGLSALRRRYPIWLGVLAVSAVGLERAISSRLQTPASLPAPV